MGENHTTGLPSQLTDIAALLAGLPLDVLPDLHNLVVAYDSVTGTWGAEAQLFTVGDDVERVAAVRAWALVLDAATRLDQPRVGGATYLEAVRALDFGAGLRIWTRISGAEAVALVVG